MAETTAVVLTVQRYTQMAQRAALLLADGRGVTARYASAAVQEGLVDLEDLRGGTEYRRDNPSQLRRGKRWFDC